MINNLGHNDFSLVCTYALKYLSISGHPDTRQAMRIIEDNINDISDETLQELIGYCNLKFKSRCFEDDIFHLKNYWIEFKDFLTLEYRFRNDELHPEE